MGKRIVIDTGVFLVLLLVLYGGYLAYMTVTRVNALWAFANEANCRIFPERCQPPAPILRAPEPKPEAKKDK